MTKAAERLASAQSARKPGPAPAGCQGHRELRVARRTGWMWKASSSDSSPVCFRSATSWEYVDCDARRSATAPATPSSERSTSTKQYVRIASPRESVPQSWWWFRTVMGGTWLLTAAVSTSCRALVASFRSCADAVLVLLLARPVKDQWAPSAGLKSCPRTLLTTFGSADAKVVSSAHMCDARGICRYSRAFAPRLGGGWGPVTRTRGEGAAHQLFTSAAVSRRCTDG
mmetsp:Transcript_71649/g.221606  ORF Transcript_71649/g.221606 Transcript_71649/m.221606 type:complete len:228 (-) Transcript_71649:1011-1694(-)